MIRPCIAPWRSLHSPANALEVRTQAADLARPGVCLQQGTKLVGADPLQISRSVTQPKKTRNVKPKYPELPRGTVGSGPWRGEFLIDQRGKVVEVWAIQEVRFEPAFPRFNRAIVDAIRQWEEFEPLIISGSPVSVCAPVTIAIDWSWAGRALAVFRA